MRSVSSSLVMAASFGLGLATLGIGAQVAQGAVVSATLSTSLNQSYTDSLNGITPTLSSDPGAPAYGQASFFTDATSDSAPGFAEGNVVVVTWGSAPATVTFDLNSSLDLAVANASAAARHLESVTIWVDAHDEYRDGFNGSLQISVDGTSWNAIAGTAYSMTAPAANYDGVEKISYSFSADEASNFRYLRLISNPADSTVGGTNQSRYTEIDATVSVPEPACMALAGLSSLSLLARRRR